MAGNYPDAPGHRLAYDRDGSILWEQNASTGAITQWTAANKQAANDEIPGEGKVQNADGLFGIIFPEPRDIVAIYLNAGDTADSVPSHSWSTNTTNGIDGTWTGFSLVRRASGGTKDDMRNLPEAVSLPGCKGIRHNRGNFGSFLQRKTIWSYHLYGSPAAGAAPDRLRFYDPAAASEVGGAYFDWGDIARGSSVTRDFRIHNPSATLTANGVTVTMEALTDTSPANTGQHDFSTDGGATWASSASLGNLAPGATSGVITLRRSTSPSAALSLWWTRMVASASSWS